MTMKVFDGYNYLADVTSRLMMFFQFLFHLEDKFILAHFAKDSASQRRAESLASYFLVLSRCFVVSGYQADRAQ